MIRVELLVICLVLGQLVLVPTSHADDDHDTPKIAIPTPAVPPVSQPSPPPEIKRPPRTQADARPQPREYDEGCRVNAGGIAAFANGENFDLPNMLNFLTSPSCIANSRAISRAAISAGVAFSQTGPFRLDNFAKSASRADLESGNRVEQQLMRTIPNLLRENPLPPNDLLPLIGQLSLLSPKAARVALTNLIQQEVYAGDQRILQEDSKGKLSAAAELARTLVRLGASESIIASDIATSIEELTILRRPNSLASFMRGLGAAANVEASLVPTFNLTAGAVNRGVQRSRSYLRGQEREDLVFAVFIAVRAAMAGSGTLEPGAAELNEALQVLLARSPLVATSLKRLWKDVTRVLAQSGSQNALADAVAASLTPNVVYLEGEDRDMVMAACRNYASLAAAVQARFLQAWFKVFNQLRDGEMEPKSFNRMRRKYFEPMVASILDMDPSLVDATWVRESLAGGLIQDEDIEKRFPRFVLAYLDRRDKAAKVQLADAGLEPTISSMAENFAVVWTLNNTHVPALMNWVKKYEQ